MRSMIALVFVVAAACGGSAKKPEGALVNEGSAATPDTCCCKSNPLTSEDGKPVYEVGNRMECSAKEGECVDEVQCTNQPAPAPAE
ncbi:MAG: hypothetical protein H0T89_06120 [Deltaproteobacteria bacterium]|nr:hypothetical protein [Deltaproteobacteria bacterium]MDQ3295603.1 hypothetical protein [Myxococcota bacterium]